MGTEDGVGTACTSVFARLVARKDSYRAFLPALVRRILDPLESGWVIAEAPVHFHNIWLGKPACLPSEDVRPAEVTGNPARVTCPACLRYLRHEEATGDRPLRPWAIDSSREPRRAKP
jgi:hypothetical protein